MSLAGVYNLTQQCQVDLSTHCARRALRAPFTGHVERCAVCSGWISRTLSLQNPTNSVALLDFKDGIYTCIVNEHSADNVSSGHTCNPLRDTNIMSRHGIIVAFDDATSTQMRPPVTCAGQRQVAIQGRG